jgi:hypothetical protein
MPQAFPNVENGALELVDPERAIQNSPVQLTDVPYFAGTDNSSSGVPFFAT